MSVQIKICGLRTPEMVTAALDADANYIGLVDFAKSPRHLEPDAMAPLAELVRTRSQGRTRVVVLSVDATPDRLAALVATVRPDLLQLHGSETPEQVREIRTRHGVPVMKVIRVATAADVDTARPFRTVADLLMFDAKAPASPLPGGTGHSFDWRLLAGVAAEGPFMLAGGLNAGNVADALRLTGAAIVDVSSGVETAPGIKSAGLIRDFAAAARAAAHTPPARTDAGIGDVADGELEQVAATHRAAILAVRHYSEAERQSWADGLAADGYRQGRAEGARIRIAAAGGRAVAGFCITFGSELRALYVHPTAQGTGLGTALLRDGESLMRAGGHRDCRLMASMNAVAFYEAHGWTLGEPVQHQTRGGLLLPAARMTKTLEATSV